MGELNCVVVVGCTAAVIAEEMDDRQVVVSRMTAEMPMMVDDFDDDVMFGCRSRRL